MFNLFGKTKRISAQEINTETFVTLQKDMMQPLIVLFTAPWCGACKMFKPIFDDLAHENRNIAINLAMVNTDSERELAQQYNIRSLPTMIIFHKGEVVYQGIVVPKMRLQEWINKLTLTKTSRF